MVILPAVQTTVNVVEVVRLLKENCGINMSAEINKNGWELTDPRTTLHLLSLTDKYNIEIAMELFICGYIIIADQETLKGLCQVLRGNVLEGRAIFIDDLNKWKINLKKLELLGYTEVAKTIRTHLCNSGLRSLYANS